MIHPPAVVSTSSDVAGGVHVSVEDNGPGLSQENLDQLFAAFPSQMGSASSSARSTDEGYGAAFQKFSGLGQGI